MMHRLGVTPRVVSELFRLIKERSPQYTFTVMVSMFELYKDGLRDLQVHAFYKYGV